MLAWFVLTISLEIFLFSMKISINFPAMFLNILNHHSRRTRKEITIVNTEYYIWSYFKTSNGNVASNSEYITPLAFTQRVVSLESFPEGLFSRVFSWCCFSTLFPGVFSCGSFSGIILQGFNPSFCPDYCTCLTVVYSMLCILHKLAVTYISSR